MKRPTRILAWGFAVAVLALGLVIVDRADPLPRMLVIVVALFVGMKGVVLVEWRLSTGRALGMPRAFAFLGWVGMRPGDFAVRHATVHALDARPGLWALTAGAGLFWITRHVAPSRPLPAAALALPALSLMFHFGLLRLLTGFWRGQGFDVTPPFDAPWRANDLRDFWSHRWNRAFSEMATLVAYRPVARVLGAPGGRLAAFVLSGLLHELAISVPARGGYGGPMLYFLLHGALVATEPPARPRVWTLAALVLPLPLLFHAPFLRGVVLPLLR
jgi:hypothetical protein